MAGNQSIISNLTIHLRPRAAEVALFTSLTGLLSQTHYRQKIPAMLEIKLTGNCGTVRLVKSAGKSPVLNVSLATNRKVGDREFTDWTSVKIWGERAEKLAPFISKGTKLLITGRPEARAFKAADGTAKAELVVHVTDLEFLSAKGRVDQDEVPEHAEEPGELALETAEV